MYNVSCKNKRQVLKDEIFDKGNYKILLILSKTALFILNFILDESKVISIINSGNQDTFLR
jgi:hypothetical protein